MMKNDDKAGRGPLPDEREPAFRSFYEEAPLPYQSLDAAGNFLDVNKAWLETLGYERDEVIGKNFADFLAGDLGEVFRKRFSRFKAEGKISGGEFKMKKKNGTMILVRFEGRIMYDDKGDFVRTQCLFQDMTEIKKAQRALKESEARYRTLFEGSPDGIIVADADTGEYIHVNPAICRELGYTEEEIKSVSRFKGIHPKEEVEKIKKLFSKQAQGKIKLAENIPFVHKDGTVRYFDVSSVLMDVDGVRRVVGLTRDITDRLMAERTLTREKETAQRYLDIAAVMIIAIDRDGRVTLVNRKGCAILGYREEEIIGKNWFDNFLPENMRKKVKEVSRKILEGEIAPLEYHENPVLTKSGEERRIAWHNVVLRGEEGGIIGHLSSGEDITEREKAREVLAESEEKYRLIAENTADYIAILKMDGTFLYLSPSHAHLGYDPAELEGMSGIDLIHPDDRIKLLPLLKKYAAVRVKDFLRLRQEMPAEHFVFRFPDKSGRWRYMESTANLIKDQKGEGYNILLISRDITGHMKIEEELRSSEERYRMFFEKGRDAIFIADAENRMLVDCNERALGLTGRTREEILSMRADQLHPEDVLERTMDVFRRQAAGEDIMVESEVLARDGRRIPVSINTALVKIQGEPRLVGVFRDITDRKKAEKELKDAFMRIEDLARFPEENPLPVLRISKEGVLLYANEASGELVEEYGMETGKAVPDKLEGMVKATYAGGENWVGEIEVRGRALSLVLAPIVRGGYVNVYGRDVTEEKRMESDLKKQVHDLEVFFEAATGREEKILELKDEIAELKRKLRERDGEKK